MTTTSEKIIYELLLKVFNGGYSGIVLNEMLESIQKDKAYITRVFYGVLEKNTQLDYIVEKLTTRRPKKPALIILKIGLYLLRYSDTPTHAAIDKTVDLARQIGKHDLKGFINAVLRKSVDFKLETKSMSVNLSVPDWIIQRLKKHYDDEFIKKILAPIDYRTHIRSNKALSFEKTELGYLVTKEQLDTLNHNDYAIMSLSSMLAVKHYISDFKKNDSINVLDLCAAPGGKAIYLKELLPNAKVIACDIHPHRLDLIKSYAKKMSADIEVRQNDATVFNPNLYPSMRWNAANLPPSSRGVSNAHDEAIQSEVGFDLVICDVPCSGLGVKQKPDVFINRKQEDIPVLNKLQSDIITTASKYIKAGGVLCYSTCTILKEENEDIVKKFLSGNSDFKLEKMLNLHPQDHNSDGFFVARMLRN